MSSRNLTTSATRLDPPPPWPFGHLGTFGRSKSNSAKHLHLHPLPATGFILARSEGVGHRFGGRAWQSGKVLALGENPVVASLHLVACNAVQRRAMQCNDVQCSATTCNAVQRGAMQCKGGTCNACNVQRPPCVLAGGVGPMTSGLRFLGLTPPTRSRKKANRRALR
jgi:hypothetical protein